MMKNQNREKGFVFLAVLFVMVSLVAISGILVAAAQSQQTAAANFVRSTRARIAADAGIDALLSRIAPGSVAAPGWTESVEGELEKARFEAKAVPYDPSRYASIPGAANITGGSVFEITSTGRVQGAGGGEIKQAVTAVIDNSDPLKPRVLLWLAETPSE